MNSNKYKCVYLPGHPRAFSNGTVYEHILVAEEKIGRQLKKEEVVHHIDQNKSNNDPNNLLVFKSRNAHSQFHAGGTIVFDEDGIADCIAMKRCKCPICGVAIYRQSKYCNACAHLLQRRADRPTREELKNMVRNESFTQIGEKYGVSYTSIKKWCKSMNIPHRKQDIEKYSDDEWENV